MNHFLDVQNGHVFALFLCIFTNFFLVLLIKKAFFRLLLCIFHNRQKNAGSRPDAAGSMRAAACMQLENSIHRRAFQPAKVSIPSAANFFPSCFFTEPNVFWPPD